MNISPTHILKLKKMEIKPVAIFRSPLTEKFGIPRQAGVAPALRGKIVLEPEYRSAQALRGLDGFDYVWLVWGFNLNRETAGNHLTVRPPRLGGNDRIGVFASRSPFRPNPLGLSSVRIESIEFNSGIINVLGADLADGTPIYDIKPYVTYTDSHPEARSGFVDEKEWKGLEVEIPDDIAAAFSETDLAALRQVLAEDPRPRYRGEDEKEYGLLFAGRNIKFKVKQGILIVKSIG